MHKIEELLQDFEMVNPELGDIIRQVREMVFAIAPECEEKVMYGGLIYALPGRMFCGLFLRKQHVSMEFDLGHQLEDENGLLEGCGKYRRHLKLRGPGEIESKQVADFIRQSYTLRS